jgi:hypothetical protein
VDENHPDQQLDLAGLEDLKEMMTLAMVERVLEWHVLPYQLARLEITGDRTIDLVRFAHVVVTRSG